MDRVVTVGRIMSASTMEPGRIPSPSSTLKMARTAATMTWKPIRPNTTDGMPTSSSMSGWKTCLPNLGWISTTKMAAPMAMGRAMIVEMIVTANDVTISGRAPVNGRPVSSLVIARFQVVPVKNSAILTPSLMNVERPRWATMKINATTTSVTSATQAPVTLNPTFSRLRFGICLAITHLSKQLYVQGVKTVGPLYFSETLPSASLTTVILETGMKPCSSTSEPWTSSESMYSRKAVVASSASCLQYMCSVAQMGKELS